ncbi:tetratricopeptide repeat protein [Gimesia aquarii]|uniref:Tetratricopeptide repeat protein n=1 Tax=Gimesia aquarii TaxID=2527964 RepID=A0A517X322_9PLAN|nr:hypothetical protein [Gimesia aquarii]QDU11900.1 tetratricopeptide repeat protein [Gimesia aquarii]
MADSKQNATPSEFNSENKQTVNKKKRSPLERVIVWGLISVALIVVLLEVNARYGYSNTLTEMQNRIAQEADGKEFLLKDAKAMVKGFPYGDERLTQSGKQLQYRWFSLFRTYAIQISVGIDGEVLSLETDVEQFDDKNLKAESSKPLVHRPALPENGLSSKFENVAVLKTDKLESQYPNMKGMLTREIVRQAFLIGAREGLGLKTRDASLRGEVLLIDNPETFPLKLITQIDPSREVTIDLERPYKNKPPFHWYSEPFILPQELGFEVLIEKTEEFSRKDFVDALKQAGYTGKAPQWIEASTIPDTSLQRLNEWNLVSQYTVIQDMHAAIENEGESPERLAVLVRAYANLGSLTESLWSPAHKVFKARALLYAERLTARREDSPWALAHRAYARAFAGRHRSALTDIEVIRSVKSENSENKRPLPDWVDLIDAYCVYKPDVLDKAVKNEDTKHLAIYLSSLLTDPVANEKQMLTITEQLLELEPACCRAMDRLCEVNSLGILRVVTEQRLDTLWPQIYRKLLEGHLPDSGKAPIEKYLSTPFNLISEPQLRVQVIDFLKDSESKAMEPSLNGLGQLLQEISFLHTHRKLKLLTGNLRVNADDVLSQSRPLVKGHPYEQFIESYSSNPDEAKAAYEKLLQSHDPHELEFNSFPMIFNSNYKLNSQAYNKLYMEAVENVDFVYQDLFRRVLCLKELVSENRQEQNSMFAGLLLRVSPHMPQTVALNIDTNREYVEKHNAELMEKYGKNPVVLTALVNRHLADYNDAKAEELLQRRIAIVPDYQSYTTLANIYKNRGETEKWKKTLEKALELPSTGLRNPLIQSKLAHYHMERGEWELAKPYAMKAAATYSGWGLQCAAKCYEGLGDLKQAEAFRRACSMRYKSSAADWYFWCVRTGQGDIESARQLAEKYLLANPDVNNLDLRMQIGVFQTIQGAKKQAFDIFQTAFKKYRDAYCGLHAALLADELEFTDQRDNLLKQVSQQWNKDFAKAELSNLFQRNLQKQDSTDWRPICFQSLIAQVSNGSPTNYYYFAGKFLEQRGQSELAEKYLQLAATSPMFVKYNCVLAVHHLRTQNKKIGARRTMEMDADYGQAVLLLHKALYLKNTEKLESAIKKIDEILELKPDLVIALTHRAQANESLENYAEAISDYKKAIKIEPEYWLPHHSLVFLLAACEREEIRDGSLALKHAQQSLELLPIKFWVNYGALAIAYAETGQFEKAIETQKQAVLLAPEKQKGKASQRVRLFSERKPYRRSSKKK